MWEQANSGAHAVHVAAYIVAAMAHGDAVEVGRIAPVLLRSPHRSVLSALQAMNYRCP